MIKKCPTCNRTYADETISFCLADGALLSAPYESVPPPPTRAESREPATEVLPLPVPPTQGASPGAPTITAAFPNPVRRTQAENETEKTGSKRLVIMAVLTLFVLVTLVAGFLIFNAWRARRAEVASAGGSDNTNALIDIPAEQPTPIASTTPSATARATPTPKLPTLNADPMLFPTDSRDPKATTTPLPTPTPTPATTVDYNRVFAGNEVDQRAQILSRPKPAYTDAARQNQIQGIVRLRMVLGANGQVGSITVVSGQPYGLSESAVAAARQIKFEPAKKDGRAVSQSVVIEYNFSVY